MEQSRILVVDDTEATRYPLVRQLKKARHELLEAGTGQECLERVAHTRIGLILLDFKLPDSSGIEVCRRLKQDSRDGTHSCDSDIGLLTQMQAGPGPIGRCRRL